MAEFNDSDTWSESADSYFSTEDSSDNSICPTPRSLRLYLADKLRVMRCIKRNEQEAASTEEVGAMAHYSGRYIPQHQLTSMLREKLEQLHAAGDDDAAANRFQPSVKRVSFFEPPIYRPQMTEQMDVDVPSGSRGCLDLSSVSSIQNGVDLARLMEEPSIFTLNFPELNSLVESASQKEVGGNIKPVQLEYLIDARQGTSAQENAERNEENISPSMNNKTNEERENNMSAAKRFVEKLFDMVKTAKPPPDHEEMEVDINETKEKGA